MPDPKAILDVASDSKGMLIPRMTTTQRDAISTPPAGLQVYNTTTNSIDIYRGGAWESLSFSDQGNNVVKVHSLTDLPSPQGNAINLEPDKIYSFSGMVNISPNYLNLNGASLRGNSSTKDGVLSNVGGAVVRSNDEHVDIRNLAIAPLSNSTSAFDLSDATGEKLCIFFPGTNVIENNGPSMGAGTVSGFKGISISTNYWRCTDGIKISGTVGLLTVSHNLFSGIANGSAIELLAGLNIDAIDISNNYFFYSGQKGIKLNSGVVLNEARLTSNMFTGVGTITDGFDSTTPGWDMEQNSNLPDSRVYGSIFMADNAVFTDIVQANSYAKIAGSTTGVKLERFTASANNTLTFIGKNNTSGKIYVGISGVSPAPATDITIAIGKNGTIIPQPSVSIRGLNNNQSFQLSLVAEVDLVTNDYLEVFIKNVSSNNDILITDMQLRVTD